jgi:hypothetical protein
MKTKILFFIPLLVCFLSFGAQKDQPLKDSEWEDAKAITASGNIAHRIRVHTDRVVQAMEDSSKNEDERSHLRDGFFKKRNGVLPQGAPIPQARFFSDLAGRSLEKNSSPSLLTPSPLKFINGMQKTGHIPPDPAIASGPNHIVEAVNSSFAIYSKGGAKLFQTTFEYWFSDFTILDGSDFFDPKIIYDQYYDRFVMLVDCVRDSDRTAYYLLSVSETSNAQGNWFLWYFDMTLNGQKRTGNWADYPGLGIDQDYIYMTGNMFSFASGKFVQSKLRILKKDDVYYEDSAPWVDIFNFRNATGQTAFTVQPVHSHGSVSNEYLIEADNSEGSKLTLYKVMNPQGRATLERKAIPVSPYSYPPNAEQRGGGSLIDTGDARLLNAVGVNNSIYTAHTISHNWESGKVSAARLYQVSTTGAVQQEITFGLDLYHYYYPVIMADSTGNIAFVFNRSSSSEFAGARFAGRRVTDEPGTIQASKTLKPGVANYEEFAGSDRNRWGDYNGISLDPDNSFWIVSEFALYGDNWGTRIARVKYN